MSTRDRPIDHAAWRAKRELIRIGEEVRIARLACGLSQARVARAISGSQAQVSRLEHGGVRHLDVVMLSRALAATGLRLSIRGFPEGSSIRDVAHVALLKRIRERLAPSWTWNVEVPVRAASRPNAQRVDPRRWDAVAVIPGVKVALEAETRLYDVQAQLARSRSKYEAGDVDRLILVVAETHHNRRVLAELGPLVRGDFPVAPRVILAALGAGRDPGDSGIVLI